MAEDFVWYGGTLVANLDKFDTRMDRAIGAAMGYHASRATAWARSHATWTDRTGNARAGLHTEVRRLGKASYAMTISHGVPYGIWLEVRWSGRYRIITPTLEHEGPEVLRTVGEIFGGM